MIYNNDKIRRRDRLMAEARAMEILRNGDFGVMSVTDSETGGGYGVPLNYVWDGDSTIYIHCAPEGEKLRNIKKNPFVTFCIVASARLLPEKFSTEYESIILKGRTSCDLPEKERVKALHLIVDKFSQAYRETGYKYAEKALPRVEVIKIEFTEFSGKCKLLPPIANFEDYTLKIIKGEKETKFTNRGIKDLFNIVTSEPEILRDATVVDKAVGKAAAALMILGKVKSVKTPMISSPALKLLKAADIPVTFNKEVPLILNHTQKDCCPMERLSSETDSPEEILKLIKKFIQDKQNGSNK